ncbi:MULTISPECIES: phosphopantetheine-binding protein [Mycoplasma]|uniref:Acyl carrier protein n=2 Tax=Mycoplasma TaxID=2093 RepID=A0A6M4J909_9MOLU|nr:MULTISPECIES: phosphopantetheine-binding protein [Mycoplasma]MBU4689531.1 acyl carrier protein [Mycoplasma zalophidermidis]MBU4690382.1 acyl carrier protein [Mycoplasma miroungigenitalium]MBU4691649.1 acyl carrier protein [Mycoplasma miroungigenitalium]MBU4693409.1 acyl carrier protein [Mycoplasma zalophidermidis]MCR8966294.1 phosphopantetheine-binding protein [Mycoplasma zalophidermidis]
MNITNLVIEKVQKFTKSKVSLNSELKELKIDSLTLAELVFDLEDELKIRVSDEELLKLKTIQDVVNLIENTKK